MHPPITDPAAIDPVDESLDRADAHVVTIRDRVGEATEHVKSDAFANGLAFTVGSLDKLPFPLKYIILGVICLIPLIIGLIIGGTTSTLTASPILLIVAIIYALFGICLCSALGRASSLAKVTKNLSNMLTEVTDQIDELQGQLHEIHTATDQLKQTSQELSTQVASLQEIRADLGQRVTELQEQNATLADQLHLLTEQIAALQANIKDFKATIIELKHTREEYRSENDRLADSVNKLEAAFKRISQVITTVVVDEAKQRAFIASMNEFVKDKELFAKEVLGVQEMQDRLERVTADNQELSQRLTGSIDRLQRITGVFTTINSIKECLRSSRTSEEKVTEIDRLASVIHDDSAELLHHVRHTRRMAAFVRSSSSSSCSSASASAAAAAAAAPSSSSPTFSR